MVIYRIDYRIHMERMEMESDILDKNNISSEQILDYRNRLPTLMMKFRLTTTRNQGWPVKEGTIHLSDSFIIMK